MSDAGGLSGGAMVAGVADWVGDWRKFFFQRVLPDREFYKVTKSRCFFAYEVFSRVSVLPVGGEMR
jgi:hypothetical protein